MPALSQNLRDVVWTRRGTAGWVGWLALLPLSGLFAVGTELRRLAYATGLLRRERAPIPVVSVGNLTVGGTGKTPLTLWLARRLQLRGLRVAIVSRGYGGQSAGPTIVSRGAGVEAEVEEVGDEAAMLGKSFTGVVVTARRRLAGVQQAAQLGCDVAVLDDGFQHLALARDFDLVVVSSRRGGLLPAGPMREGWRALRRADAVVLAIRGEETDAVPLPLSAVRARLTQCTARFRPNGLVVSDSGRWEERPIATISGARVLAVCGIAEPAAFYQTLRAWGADVREIFEYPDHHAYTADDWQNINREAHSVDYVVTTEKDLIKLERFPFAKDKLVAVRIIPELEAGDELVERVLARIAR